MQGAPIITEVPVTQYTNANVMPGVTEQVIQQPVQQVYTSPVNVAPIAEIITPNTLMPGVDTTNQTINANAVSGIPEINS